MRTLVKAAATALALALLLAPPAPAASAQGGIYARVLKAYENHGGVSPCQFSSQQLETALKGINTYGAQYFADFTNAVQNALAARASGVCASGGTAARVAAGAAPDRTPLKLGPLTPGTSSGLPLPLLLMAVFAGVAALVGASTLLLRRRDGARGLRGQ